ncbi:MAG TPA: hypothetical protein VKX29_05465, partial [Brumimicrobium sp.]|nr:hypothetical protein [Brumimicrobium sp.]
MIKNIFFFSLSIAFLVGCNTKFSVNGEYVEQPVVHLLLDQGQEYHFLKLNKTFLKEGNAMEFAKDPALSYFDSVVATVKEIKNGSTLRSWTLKDTVITNKSDGAFYAPEQKLYYFKADPLPPNPSNPNTLYLDEDAIYRLHIDIDYGNHIVKGQTELVKGVQINYPQPNQSFNFADNNVLINGYKSTPITFTSGNGAYYKMQLRFDYKEVSSSGSEIKSVLWNLGEVDAGDVISSTNTIFADGEAFYEYLGQKIPVDSDVTERNVRGFEIILTAASSD